MPLCEVCQVDVSALPHLLTLIPAEMSRRTTYVIKSMGYVRHTMNIISEFRREFHNNVNKARFAALALAIA